MADQSHRVTILIAVIGVIGTITAALIGNWDKIVSPPVKMDSGQPRPPIPEPPRESLPNIGGMWRDPMFDTMSQITQRGDTFTFTASGVACRGSFQSSGSGTIRGTSVNSTYRSSYSQGSCSGTVSPDGMQMTSTCDDSACGRFTTSMVRQ